MNNKYAVDTNVILDVLVNDPNFKDQSLEKLFKYSIDNQLVINEPVFTELLVYFPSKMELNKFLDDTKIIFNNTSEESLIAASFAWKIYLKTKPKNIACPICGKKIFLNCPKCEHPISFRQHIVTDFLIGGFALSETNGLLTRDTGYYKTYFPKLKII